MKEMTEIKKGQAESQFRKKKRRAQTIDDFRLSFGGLRRIRQRNKRSAIYGTSETSYGLKGVPHTKDIFIFRLDEATSESDVKQYLVRKEVNSVSKIVCVSHEDATHKSIE